MISLDYNTLPSKEIFVQQFEKECDETYTLGFPHHCGNKDFEIFQEMTEQGIDSHLEAIFFTESVDNTHINFDLDVDSLYVLIRRLCNSDDEAAWNLASSILYTLEIEWV